MAVVRFRPGLDEVCHLGLADVFRGVLAIAAHGRAVVGEGLDHPDSLLLAWESLGLTVQAQAQRKQFEELYRQEYGADAANPYTLEKVVGDG